VSAVGQQAQHHPLFVVDRHDVQRRGSPGHDRRRASVVGIALVDPASFQQPHPSRQLRRDIDHVLAGTDELLSQHRPQPARPLHRPGARLEPLRPGQQAAALMTIGVDTDRVEHRLGTVDHDRRVRPLMRIDPDNEHHVLPCSMA
jgi:hypothetical protein